MGDRNRPLPATRRVTTDWIDQRLRQVEQKLGIVAPPRPAETAQHDQARQQHRQSTSGAPSIYRR